MCSQILARASETCICLFGQLIPASQRREKLLKPQWIEPLRGTRLAETRYTQR